MSDHITASGLSGAVLARLGVPAGVPVLGSIAPDARLVVTAEVAPVYIHPNAKARIIGSIADNVQVRDEVGYVRMGGRA
jgi:hypothetical protein